MRKTTEKKLAHFKGQTSANVDFTGICMLDNDRSALRTMSQLLSTIGYEGKVIYPAGNVSKVCKGSSTKNRAGYPHRFSPSAERGHKTEAR